MNYLLEKVRRWLSGYSAAPQLQSAYDLYDGNTHLARLALVDTNDMFWTEWSLEPMHTDPRSLNRLYSDAFWGSPLQNFREADGGRQVSFILSARHWPDKTLTDEVDIANPALYICNRPNMISLRGPYKI